MSVSRIGIRISGLLVVPLLAAATFALALGTHAALEESLAGPPTDTALSGADQARPDEAWRTALGVPTACGDPAATDCFVPVFPDAFCNDMCDGQPCPGCCQAVCDFDPFCCVPWDEGGFGWDGTCSQTAEQICSCLPGTEPPNDECVNAVAIDLGTTPISNQCATLGGPSHNAAACRSDLGALGLDIWYTYPAMFTGELIVSTCNQLDQSWDSIIVAYEG